MLSAQGLEAQKWWETSQSFMKGTYELKTGSGYFLCFDLGRGFCFK